MIMTSEDWSKIEHFSPDEFSSQFEISNTNKDVFYTLDAYREDLGYSVYPSKVKGTLARNYGDSESRHYCIGRLSTATDIFPDCSPLEAWIVALHYFGGVGAYFDTHRKKRKWVMLHCDLRSGQTLWYRENGVYKTLTNRYDYELLLRKLSND